MAIAQAAANLLPREAGQTVFQRHLTRSRGFRTPPNDYVLDTGLL